MRTNLRDQFDATERAAFKPKIIARNTFRFERDGETVIRLHGTDIVTKHKDGSVTLNSGGWKTATTKERMNGALPAGYVMQERGLWYVCSYRGGPRVPYFDGIRVPQCFDKMPKEAERAVAKDKKLASQIKTFVAKLDVLECLPEPSAGDCWYCMMRTQDGKSLGEVSGDNDHIREHVREGYLHGSLIMNALKWAGYRDPGYIFALEQQRRAKGNLRGADWVKRAMRRYLKRQLGLVS